MTNLGDPDAIVAIDETSFPKRGTKSAGVAHQYCGTTKQVENCQVGVFLSYISHLGHTLLDRELYLPRHWVEDRARCQEAGIPETVLFQTKCELAKRMMERLHQAQVPVTWVVADTVYGNNLDLRTWLEDHRYCFALAVACTEQVGVQTPEGRKLLTVTEVERLLLHKEDWQQFSVKTGTKGPLTFDWACVPILHGWEDDGRHWLLIRRIPTNPTEKTYYLVFGPVGTTLEMMARAIGARWCIEEEFENAKDLGLDHYEVRSFVGWFRHITLVLLALAVLSRPTRCCARGIASRHPIPHPADRPRGAPSAGTPPFPLASKCDGRVGLVLVAPMPAGKGTRLSRKTAPELELVVLSLSPFSRPEGLLTASRARLATSDSSSFWGGGSLLSLHSPWKCPCSPCCPFNL